MPPSPFFPRYDPSNPNSPSRPTPHSPSRLTPHPPPRPNPFLAPWSSNPFPSSPTAQYACANPRVAAYANAYLSNAYLSNPYSNPYLAALNGGLTNPYLPNPHANPYLTPAHTNPFLSASTPPPTLASPGLTAAQEAQWNAYLATLTQQQADFYRTMYALYGPNGTATQAQRDWMMRFWQQYYQQISSGGLGGAGIGGGGGATNMTTTNWVQYFQNAGLDPTQASTLFGGYDPSNIVNMFSMGMGSGGDPTGGMLGGMGVMGAMGAGDPSGGILSQVFMGIGGCNVM